MLIFFRREEKLLPVAVNGLPQIGEIVRRELEELFPNTSLLPPPVGDDPHIELEHGFQNGLSDQSRRIVLVDRIQGHDVIGGNKRDAPAGLQPPANAAAVIGLKTNLRLESRLLAEPDRQIMTNSQVVADKGVILEVDEIDGRLLANG